MSIRGSNPSLWRQVCWPNTLSEAVAGFSDKQVDDLFTKQAAMLDPKERKKTVTELQQRILDQVITPVIFWDAYNMGFWKEVRGYQPGFGAFGHNNLDHVWLVK